MTCKEWRELYEELADKYFEATGELAPPPVSPRTGNRINVVLIAPSRLEQWYLRDGMRLREIADILKCSPSTVSNLLRKAGIPARKPGEYPKTENQLQACRRHISQLNASMPGYASRKGGAATRLKRIEKGYEFGGHERKGTDGYIWVYAPEHPRANRAGCVPKHTLVMERHIERYLEDDEVVHHINHIRDDNRLENLQLMRSYDHLRMHALEMQRVRKGKP